jgi:hypothetical protein
MILANVTDLQRPINSYSDFFEFSIVAREIEVATLINPATINDLPQPCRVAIPRRG